MKLSAQLRNCESPTVALAGHAALGIHELLPTAYKIYYITVLRDPFERLLSYYRFERAHYYPCADIRDYIKSTQPNFLVGRLGDGSLKLARKRLATFYWLFGLTERFDDFLLLLSSRTGVPLAKYESLNRTLTGKPEVDPELRLLFNQRNSPDIELYEWAREEFDRRYRHPTRVPTEAKLDTARDKDSILTPSARIITLLD